MKQDNIFIEIQDIVKRLPRNKIIMLFSFIFLYGIAISVLFAIPLWFENPITLCTDQSSGKQYKCIEEQACKEFYQINQKNDKNYTSIIDYQNSKISISLRFQLICQNRQIKYDCIKIIYFFSILVYILMVSIKINSNQLRLKIIKGTIIMIVSLKWILLFLDEIYLIAIGLGLLQLLGLSTYSQILDILVNFYNEEFQKIMPVIMTISYGSIGCLFPLMNQMLNGNYQNMMIACALPLTLNLFILLHYIDLIQPHKQITHQQSYNFILKDLVHIFNSKKRSFYVVLIFNYFINAAMYQIYYLMTDNQQNPSLIILFQNFFSIVSAFSVGYVLSNRPVMKAYNQLIYIFIGVQTLAVLIPPSKQEGNQFYQYIILINIIYISYKVNLLQILLIMIVPIYVSDQYMTFIVNTAVLISRFACQFIPEIQYNLKYKYDLDLFIFISFLYIIQSIVNYYYLKNSEPFIQNLSNDNFSVFSENRKQSIEINNVDKNKIKFKEEIEMTNSK